MLTLEQEFGELKARVDRLETTIRQMAGHKHAMTLPGPDQLTEQEQILTWLKTEGLVRDPTAEEHCLAAEWDTLPEEEKQNHLRFMRSLTLDPPLSQILVESRH